jgi:hypothetical protein
MRLPVTHKFMTFAAVMLLGTSLASANLITNGTLAPANPAAVTAAGGYQLSNSGADAVSLPNWTINNVDLITNYWDSTPAGSPYSIDLNGNASGLMYQSFATSAGQSYTVSLWYAGNPDRSAGATFSRTADSIVYDGTSVGGAVLATQALSASVIDSSRSHMMWQQISYIFTANGATSTLAFAGGLSGSNGIAVTNIEINANKSDVPEPATLGIMGIGLTLIGIKVRKAKKV